VGILITEVTSFGVVMLADSIISGAAEGKAGSHAGSAGVRRLLAVPSLHAGVGYWGMDELAGRVTDAWLTEFLAEHAARCATVGDLARALADELNRLVGPVPGGQFNLGFHVAGHEDDGDESLPSFYHVHAGVSQALQMRGISVDPDRFNANHDLPPSLSRDLVAQGRMYLTHNGQFQLYSLLLQLLGSLSQHLRPRGVVIPSQANLAGRVDYLTFQVRTVAELYRLSNLGPLVGGTLRYLALRPGEIASVGTAQA
jgi:hypothetical protein